MTSPPFAEQADASARLPRTPRVPQRIASEAEALRVAHVLADDFRAGALERDRDRRLPWDELDRYTDSGLGTISIPAEYGGLGASWRTVAEVFVILSAADASLGQIPHNHVALIQNLRDMGTEPQRRRWYADVLSGHRLGNAGPERKDRAARVTDATARVRRMPEGLRASGSRFYSTGALYAHWIPFRAVDDQDRPVQVWVRRDAPGLRVVDDWNGFGQRTTASGTVLLDDVPVDEDALVALYAHADVPNLSGPVSQLIQAAIDAGIAEGAWRDALDYVRTRTRAWMDAGVEQASDDPYIVHEVGQLRVRLDAARAVLDEAAATLDEIASRPVDAAQAARASIAVAEAKVLTTEAALAASEQLLALAGTSSVRAAHGLDRHWRDARVHTLHDPVRWKVHAIGNHVLNGVAPRRHQWN